MEPEINPQLALDPQIEKADLRRAAKSLAYDIRNVHVPPTQERPAGALHKVPQGRERALALTKLEETIMWANAGIARSE